MSSKILLVGYQSDTLQEIYDLLYRSRLYQILRVQTQDQMIHKLATQSIHLTILDNDILNIDRMTQIKNLRTSGYGSPLLVIARAISLQAKDLSKTMNRIALLEKPFEYKDFLGLTNKLIAGRDVLPQQYKRFYTNQTAILEPLGGKSAQYTGYIRNLSKGGALVEIPEASNGDIRGIIRMNVVLDQLQKAYEVNARVVWNSRKTSWSKTGHSVGVEFLQAKDIYRNLLTNL